MHILETSLIKISLKFYFFNAVSLQAIIWDQLSETMSTTIQDTTDTIKIIGTETFIDKKLAGLVNSFVKSCSISKNEARTQV